MEVVYSQCSENMHLYVVKKVTTYTDIDFLNLFDSAEISRFNEIKSESRKAEFYTVRLLLKQILPESKDRILYNIDGKPTLKGYQISISHSREFVSIILHSEFAVGIDIEEFRETIRRTAYKFMTDSETKEFTSVEDMILVWSSKEALYKLSNISPEFKDHYSVKRINTELLEGKLISEKVEKAVNLHYIRTHKYCLVWCIDDSKQ